MPCTVAGRPTCGQFRQAAEQRGRQLSGVSEGLSSFARHARLGRGGRRAARVGVRVRCVTEFSTGLTLTNAPADITAGPDGKLWFTEQGLLPARRQHHDRTGDITEYPVGLLQDPGRDRRRPRRRALVHRARPDRRDRAASTPATGDIVTSTRCSIRHRPDRHHRRRRRQPLVRRARRAARSAAWRTDGQRHRVRRRPVRRRHAQRRHRPAPTARSGSRSSTTAAMARPHRDSRKHQPPRTPTTATSATSPRASPARRTRSSPPPTASSTSPSPTTPPRIGRIKTDGTIKEYRTGLTADSAPVGIAEGGDEALWFTAGASPGRIGRLVTEDARVHRVRGRHPEPRPARRRRPGRHHARPRRQHLVHRERPRRPHRPHDRPAARRAAT